MARQEMSFQLTYTASDTATKCKSCQGTIQSGALAVGAKSEVMYDPMWYHFSCFWDRCPYRKQMSRHVDNYTELTGYSKLTAEDRQSFKEALDKVTGGALSASVGGGHRGSLKRRSESDDLKLGHLKSQKTNPPNSVDGGKILAIPKLAMSATERISRSPTPFALPDEEESQGESVISISDNLTVTVRTQNSDDSGADIVISDGSDRISITKRQWEALTAIFTDVTGTLESSVDGFVETREFPLLDSLVVTATPNGNNGATVTINKAKVTIPEGRAKSVTLTPAQWKIMSYRSNDVDAILMRI